MSTYSENLLAIENSNILVYFPLDELTETTYYDRKNSYDGVAVGTVNQRLPGISNYSAVNFEVNSGVDILTTGLKAAFDGDEGSFSILVKTNNESELLNSELGWFVQLYVDDDNYARVIKTAANTIQWRYISDGNDHARTVTPSVTEWIQLGMTWSKANDEIRAYADGVLQGTAINHAGSTFSTSDLTEASLGFRYPSGNKDSIPAALGHFSLWDKPLSAANMVTLATF